MMNFSHDPPSGLDWVKYDLCWHRQIQATQPSPSLGLSPRFLSPVAREAGGEVSFSLDLDHSSPPLLIQYFPVGQGPYCHRLIDIPVVYRKAVSWSSV